MLTLSNACRVRGHIGASIVLVIGVGAAVAVADPPAVRIDWSVNGGSVNTAWPDGSGPSALSTFSYVGQDVDPFTGIELTYNLTADPYASFGGNLAVFNHMDGPVDLSVAVILDFTPTFAEGSDLSGQVIVGLTTDSGGGQIQSQSPALWQAVIDDVVVGFTTTLFHDPFWLSNSAAGSSSTQANFGIPLPVPGPPIMSNLGYEVNFTLTSLDTASVTSTFAASGDALTCAGDLNTDGAVDAGDFVALLHAWGPCQRVPCDADLDGDGLVGVTDMLGLLASWGTCS